MAMATTIYETYDGYEVYDYVEESGTRCRQEQTKIGQIEVLLCTLQNNLAGHPQETKETDSLTRSLDQVKRVMARHQRQQSPEPAISFSAMVMRRTTPFVQPSL
jgi:hypothetical protein